MQFELFKIVYLMNNETFRFWRLLFLYTSGVYEFADSNHKSVSNLFQMNLSSSTILNFLKYSPKVFRKQRIDERVNGRIAVPQPEQHGKEDGLDTFAAKGTNEVHTEEWKPAEDETADYDAEGLCCFGLHSEAFHLEINKHKELLVYQALR